MDEHKSDEQLQKEMTDASKLVEVGATYTHYKTSDSRYQVKELGVLEADDSVCVIYRSLNGSKPTFVRPLSEWIEEVQWQGKTLSRFKNVQEP